MNEKLIAWAGAVGMAGLVVGFVIGDHCFSTRYKMHTTEKVAFKLNVTTGEAWFFPLDGSAAKWVLIPD